MSSDPETSKIKLALIEAAKAVTIAVIAGVSGYLAAPNSAPPPANTGLSQDSIALMRIRDVLADDGLTLGNMQQHLAPYVDAKRVLDEYEHSFLYQLFLLERVVQDRVLRPRALEGDDRDYNRRIQVALGQINALPENHTIDDDPVRTHTILVAFQRQYNERLNAENGTNLSCGTGGERHPPRYLCPEGVFGARTVGAIRDRYRTQNQ